MLPEHFSELIELLKNIKGAKGEKKKQEAKEKLVIFVQNINNPPPPPPSSHPSSPPPPPPSSSSSSSSDIEGTGLKGVQIFRETPKGRRIKQKIIFGKGLKIDKFDDTITTGKYRYMKLSDKHLLELGKYDKNMLMMVYSSNFKPIHLLSNRKITDDFKEVFDNIINKKFYNKLYNLLNLQERRMLKTINMNVFDNKFDIKDDENEKQEKEFELLLGSFQAGNNNPDVIKRLKQLIIIGINERRIAPRVGYGYLIQLSI